MGDQSLHLRINIDVVAAGKLQSSDVVELKAWQLQSGLWWKLHRFTDFLEVTQHVYLDEWLRKGRLMSFRALWEALAFSTSDCWLPSMRADKYRAQQSQDHVLSQEAQKSPCISSVGVLCMLFVISQTAKKIVTKNKALAAFHSFCRRMLPGDVASNFLQDGMPAPFQARCPAPKLAGRCPHYEQCLLAGEGAPIPQEAFSMMLLKLLQLHSVCQACLHLCTEALGLFHTVPVVQFIESLAYTTDPLEAAKEKGNKRQRPVDTDLKTAITYEAMKKKRAASPGLFLQATNISSASNSYRWSEELLGQYQSYCKALAQTKYSFTVVADAKRIGNPAEQTEVMVACLLGQDHVGHGVILPPQVHWPCLVSNLGVLL